MKSIIQEFVLRFRSEDNMRFAMLRNFTKHTFASIIREEKAEGLLLNHENFSVKREFLNVYR